LLVWGILTVPCALVYGAKIRFKAFEQVPNRLQYTSCIDYLSGQPIIYERVVPNTINQL
jgi:hypothetical protein